MSLARIERLLAALGNPERRLPPVFHVAGTNGKGSTVAFLRACLEAAGLRVHVFTSPHLVNFNERIRVAGKLIADDALLALFRDMLEVNAGQPLTIFEATTVLAFLAFSRTPADACVLEVGMGGRLDATNVVPDPAVCGIAQLGLDHTAFLGTTILQIAAEKAAIAAGRQSRTLPLCAGGDPALRGSRGRCRRAGCAAGADWEVARYGEAMHYRDASGRLELPLPRLLGAHQVDNAGLAIAMLRHQSRVAVPEAAIRAGIGWAEWPGRLQAIESGPLHAMLPPNARLTVDGAHNPASARVLADALSLFAERPITLILGSSAPRAPRRSYAPLPARWRGFMPCRSGT
nr:Mur ligase family protein [Hankyongella ginsenosidimutans]